VDEGVGTEILASSQLGKVGEGSGVKKRGKVYGHQSMFNLDPRDTYSRAGGVSRTESIC